jgi:type I restriction-modification system DNA methylase subunit
MYYPKSPYEFSVIPVEIMGHSYEQYLGKVIRITPGHRIKIEEKPEVRKAGGVYYTPQYIVDYIVKNTIGKLLEGKTPEEVAKLKFCDPACGSGSFLIGAYKYLLDWHWQYYQNNKRESSTPRFSVGNTADSTTHNTKDASTPRFSVGSKYLTPEGNLTTSLKKQILLNNIYGVDIDTNAVEVTKLSLMLKALEGETEATINNQLTLLHERVLPTLDNNIKSGNSLIDVDFYDNQIDFEPGVEKKIKPFNWESNFPEVFKHGGFDAVIGNPPYLNMTNNIIAPIIFKYYNNKFNSIKYGSSKNLFQLFIEKCIELKPKMLSFIIPESLVNTSSNGNTREIILKNYNLSKIVYFDHFVFQDATIGTNIIVLNKCNSKSTIVELIDKNFNINEKSELLLEATSSAWEIKLNNIDNLVINKIQNSGKEMKEFVTMSKGMAVKDRNEKLYDSYKDGHLPFILGKNMNRYRLIYDKYANYSELNIVGGTRDFNKHISVPRLLIRRTGSIVCATYSNTPELVESTVYILKTDLINYYYLLGILNSKIITYYLSKKLITNAQGFPQILMGQLDQLPIIIPDNQDKISQGIMTNIISNVEITLKLNLDLQTATLPEQKDQLKARIDYTDKKIEKLV